MDAIERMWRRVQLMIGRGRVTTGNDAGVVQLLQVVLGALEIRDNTPRVAEYGLTSMPPAGTDAILAFIGGDRSNGVIIATNHQQYRMTGLQNGEVALYDDLGQSVYLTRNGIVVTAPNITLNATSGVQVNTPMLACSGDILDHSNDGGKTMAAMRQIFDQHQHKVAGVQGGGATVTSAAPNQTQ